MSGRKDMDRKLAAHEEVVIKRQQIAVIVGLVFLAIGGFLSAQLFGSAKYGILGVCIPMLYLGASSIKNRISLFRPRGRNAYSRDTRALVFGVVMIVLAIIYAVVIFLPGF